ncbi:CHAT domain-containing protein [bacterium]|nr:CHAT domain-containing protein [bacterium]
MPKPVNQQDKRIKILFFSANPEDTEQLRIDKEIRQIKQALLQTEFRDKFALEQEWAVRASDLQAHLLHHKPDIVHFSGHGSEASEIVLEDGDGNSYEVPAQALSKLFEIFKNELRCVVLNACYSAPQAQAIAQHIDCVVGMSKAIGDEAAISFAVAFYRALGYGKDVKTAFDLGCLQIHLENLEEQDTPKLIAGSKDPQEIIFVKIDEIERSDGSAPGSLVGKLDAEKVVVANKIDTVNM